MLFTKEITDDAFASLPLANKDTLFFDIETTGIPGGSSHISVIGATVATGNTAFVRQWFVERPDVEKEALAGFLEFSRNFGTIVSYNGVTFDVPYLNGRAAFYGLTGSLEGKNHIDLLKLTRPFAKVHALENRKLKTVEKALGIRREDEISGADCITCYRQYLSSGNPFYRDLILLHNQEDITNLIKVSAVLAYEELFTGKFKITGLDIEEKQISIRLCLSCPLTRFPLLENDFWHLSASGNTAHLTFTAQRGVKKLFRRDYKNYYYLPAEDHAVHKSAGCFVDKKYRVPATAATCYEKFEGSFFLQPADFITPCFRDARSDKRSYFRAAEFRAAGSSRNSNGDLPPDRDLRAATEPVHDLCAAVCKALIP